MAGIHLGGWKRLLLLVPAVVTSSAVLFTSISFWFSAPSSSSALAAYNNAIIGSSSQLTISSLTPDPPFVPPPSSSTTDHYGRDFIALSRNKSPVPAAPYAFFPPPSPSLAPQFESMAVYEDEYDQKTPPLEVIGLKFAPAAILLLPSPSAHPPSLAVNFPDAMQPATRSSPSPVKIPNGVEVIHTSSPVPEIAAYSRETTRQLMHTKKEMACAPATLNDPHLHAPLFLNVSLFKRSYELMERVLKVYIYKDGAPPLFHTPVLGGIYASEGWFMKLMEGNKQFVTDDPEKAHLFYMPYSSLQLRVKLHVPGKRPLSTFLRNYVNMIAAKYPFWNRTKGADHFLVGCHDWAPYATRLHDELRENAIKAVCNADVSEGVFIRGKDVSLPETNIRTPKRPQRGIGGRPALKRPILAFFAGHMHGRVRPVLLRFWKGRDEDMRIYETLPEEIARRMSYAEHMKSSRFCICPMGYEVNSPRIVEAVYHECVPVIVADNFVLPFEEVLDWRAFSIVVEEKDVPRLKSILLGVSVRDYTTLQMNVRKLQKHFLWNVRPKRYDLFHMILHSIWFNRLRQIHLQ